MASTTMAELLKAAEDAGISSYTPPDGPGEFEVIRANAGKTKKGDPKFGVKFKVLGGPDDGKSFWLNYNLIPVKNNGESNAKGLAMTFRDLETLGADSTVVATWDVDDPDCSEKVEAALVGTRVSAEVKTKQSGEWTNVNLNRLKRVDAAPTPPAPAADAPASKPF